VSGGGRLALGGEQRPRSGDAFECVFAAVGELEAGSGNQWRDGRRDEDFVGLRGGDDSCGNVYCDTADVIAADFDLAGV
jgi:hypothetical protein